MTILPDLYSDFVFAQVTATVSSGDTVITVDDTSAFPADNTLLGKTRFTISFESGLTHPNGMETVAVVSVDSATQISVSAVMYGHPIGTYIKGTLTAAMLRRLRAGYSDSTLPARDDDVWLIGDRFLLGGSNTSYVYTNEGWAEVASAAAPPATLSPFLLMGA